MASCKAEITNDPEYCKKDTYPEGCYDGIARRTKNPDLCFKMENKYAGRSCITGVAYNSRDIEICSLIDQIPIDKTGISGKDECIAAVTREPNENGLPPTFNPSDCAKIEKEETKRYCYEEMAIHFKDETYCQRDECFADVAVAKLDPTLCEKIKNDLMIKNGCYGGIAVTTGDTSTCEKISCSKRIEECYSNTAQAKKDQTICEKIQDPYVKYKCKNNYCKGSSKGSGGLFSCKGGM